MEPRLKRVVHAFSSRLDYWNSLAYTISDALLRRLHALQAVQNSAASLVIGSRNCYIWTRRIQACCPGSKVS